MPRPKSQLADSYSYLRPEETYTIDQFLACQSDDSLCHYTTSFLERIGHLKQSIYNVIDEYIEDILEEYAVTIELDDEQYNKYKYKPKLLCYDVYEAPELYILILVINDMYSVKQFTKKRIKMLTTDGMDEMCKYIINDSSGAIEIYNKAHGI